MPPRRWYTVLGAAIAACALLPGQLLQLVGIQRRFSAPDFKAQDVDGRSTYLSNCLGRPTLLFLFSTTCPHLGPHARFVDGIGERYREDTLCLMRVALDEKGPMAIRKYTAGAEGAPIYAGHAALPPSFWSSFEPSYILIDRDGGVIWKQFRSSLLFEELEERIRRLIFDGPLESRLPPVLNPPDDPGDAPAEIARLTDVVQYSLSHDRFDALEEMAANSRQGKEKFRDGRWKIAFFYDAMRRAVPDDADETTRELQVARLRNWISAHPQSVTARIALADVYIDWASAGPGGPEKLESARKLLVEAEQMPEKCPHLYDRLLLVARLQRWDRQAFDKLFERAAAAVPDYQSIYFRMLQYLLPESHGRAGEWEDFIDRVAQLTEERHGLSFYSRTAFSQSFDGRYGPRGERFFESTRVSYPKMRQGFSDWEKRFPGSRWVLNNFTWFDCIARDKETARGLFERIGDNYSEEVWGSASRYAYWRRWAMTTTRGERLKQAISRYWAQVRRT